MNTWDPGGGEARTGDAVAGLGGSLHTTYGDKFIDDFQGTTYDDWDWDWGLGAS